MTWKTVILVVLKHGETPVVPGTARIIILIKDKKTIKVHGEIG